MNQAPYRHANIIVRHWRGDLPLWVSYWAVGFSTSIFLIVAATVLTRLLLPGNEFIPLGLFFAVALYWLLAIAACAWQAVGVWRSATNYRTLRASAGRRSFWAGFAQFGVIVGALQFVVAVLTQAIPQLTEATKIAFLRDPDIPSYHLRVMRNGTEIEISGGFKYGLADDFKRIAAAAPLLKVVHLNSPGGRIGEADKLRRIITERRLITYTSRVCASACVIAFSGGRERWLASGAKLGFHSGTFAGMNANFARRILAPLGASPAFIYRASVTPPADMWYPSTDELRSNKVITGVADAYMFAMSGYGPDITQQELATELKRGSPLFAELAQKNPDLFRSLADSFHVSYIRGDSEGEAQDKLRARLVPYLRSLIPIADDASILRLEKVVADEYAALKLRDPKLCSQYALGTNPGNVSRYLPRELLNREVALYVEIMKSADAQAYPPPTAAELQPYQRAVLGRLLSRFPKAQVELLFKKKLSESDFASYCDDVIAMSKAIVALGAPGGPMMIRYMYSPRSGE